MNVQPVFGFGSEQDPKKQCRANRRKFHQGGLGLPERDYYFATDERSKKIREAYVVHMTAMFALVGDDTATAAWGSSIGDDIGTRLAKASDGAVDLRDRTRIT